MSRQEATDKQRMERIVRLMEEKEGRERELLGVGRERDAIKKEFEEKEREAKASKERLAENKKEVEGLRKELGEALLRQADKAKEVERLSKEVDSLRDDTSSQTGSFTQKANEY